MSVRRLDPVQPTEPFTFTPENLLWAKKTIAQYPAGKQASAVIALLWRAQEQNNGWVTRPALEYVGEMLDMAFIRVYEIATFYTMFQLSPVGKKAHIQVCGTTPCMLRGAEGLKQVCRNKIHPDPHHVSADGNFSWEEVECLGACVNAPMVQVWKDTYEDLTPESLSQLLDDMAAGRLVKPGPQDGRQFSAPKGGPTSLTDPTLYDKPRTFTRREAAPAPTPATPASPVPAPPLAPTAKPSSPEAALAASLAAVKGPVAERKEPAPSPAAKPKNMSEPVPPPPRTPPQTPSAFVASAEKKGLSPKATDEAVNKLAKLETPPKKDATPKLKSPPGAPELLAKARGGKPDDLQLIWGVGPGLEKVLHKMGIYHFDQIASWSAAELTWVDQNLTGFKGRAKRDDWIKQSKKLATGWRPEHAQGDKPKGRG